MPTVYGAPDAKGSDPGKVFGRGRRASISGGGSGGAISTGAMPSAVLDGIINQQIIPRLLMAHADGESRGVKSGQQAVPHEDVLRFASLPLALEADRLLALVEDMLARGASVESVFVDVLAFSARKLGQHWEEDECDFLDVTMGLWRLQEVMREVALRYPPSHTAPVRPRAALFSPMPGDVHSFGTLMVQEMFVRAGWLADAVVETDSKELLRLISVNTYDLVGLTISCDCPISKITGLIAALRSVSRSPDVKFLIGGRMVNANCALVHEVGADGSAADACGALELAEKLVPVRSFFDKLGA